MHGGQAVGGGVRRGAPGVLHSTMREMVVRLPRVHSTAFAHELQQEFRLFAAGSGPGTTAFGGNTGIRARGHQRLYGLVTKPQLTKTSSSISNFGERHSRAPARYSLTRRRRVRSWGRGV